MAVVSITAAGDPRYGLCAHQTVRSVLDHSDFHVIAACDAANAALLPRSDRVHIVPIEHRARFRAEPFLAKFDAWRSCLELSDDDLVVHLDADAVLVAPLTDADLRDALGSRDLAMVEQTWIVDSDMDRAAFLAHYVEHSHAYLAPLLPAPTLESFRFFNSGVIVFRRLELRNLLRWVDEVRASVPEHHGVGEHMIADQDYLQVWANEFHRGACAELAAGWNHCPLWDRDFPDPGARIIHLSNFCNGPPVPTALALQDLRRPKGGDPDRWDDLAFCLVTHQSGAVVGACVDALSAFAGAEIVVVDNASTDDTVALLETRGVRVHRNAANRGFAAAANDAARRSDRPLLCFVNPDCFLHVGAFAELRDRLGADEDLVLVPDYVQDDGEIVPGVQPGYTRAKVLRDVADTTPFAGRVGVLLRSTEVDDDSWNWPLAACMVVRRATFERVGGFDERYFCYMEDVEFGRSLDAIGGRVAPLGSAVVHLGEHGAAIDAIDRNQLLDDARIAFARDRYGVAFGGAMRAVRRAGAVVASRRVRR